MKKNMKIDFIFNLEKVSGRICYYDEKRMFPDVVIVLKCQMNMTTSLVTFWCNIDVTINIMTINNMQLVTLQYYL